MVETEGFEPSSEKKYLKTSTGLVSIVFSSGIYLLTRIPKVRF
ncbi:MAG: hypothetical protein CH104c_0699 [Candidatus Woesebacteria bacterium]|nr:MAG: hypothetical protein CH104c_0699 [Candidatus Woesebacteria bacterium]